MDTEKLEAILAEYNTKVRTRVVDLIDEYGPSFWSDLEEYYRQCYVRESTVLKNSWELRSFYDRVKTGRQRRAKAHR